MEVREVNQEVSGGQLKTQSKNPIERVRTLIGQLSTTPKEQGRRYYRELVDILQGKSTRKIDKATVKFEETPPGAPEDINRQTWRRRMYSGELHEIDVDADFKDILTTIDNELFGGRTGSLAPGFRTQDVRVGLYSPPARENVPELMDTFTNKITSLFNSVNLESQNAFIAWSTWCLLNIHPKLDGNGRFSKAFAEYLALDKKILGTQSDLWKKVFQLTDIEIAQEVAQRQGIELPQVFTNNTEVSDQEFRNIRNNFYRKGGRDWVAEILSEAIEKTTVDENGNFKPAGLSPSALSLLTEFIEQAPRLEAF